MRLANDTKMHLRYVNVVQYLARKRRTAWPINSHEHGSVVMDEITLTKRGTVLHHWQLQDARILIEAEDVAAEFELPEAALTFK